MNKPFKNFTEKFTVILIGVAVFFLLLEISLRIIGVVSLKKNGNRSVDDIRNGSYVILCLGDSFTFGMGASYGEDYPSQLEAKLNSIPGSKKFKVINAGKLSYNTMQILGVLKDNLNRGIKPDLVIFLGGNANQWNYLGYNIYLKGMTPSAIINDHLQGIRIYKLARLLSMNIKDKIKAAKLLEHNMNSRPSVEMPANDGPKDNEGNNPQKENNKINNDIHLFHCIKYERYDEAIGWLKEKFKRNPNDSYFYLDLGRIYNKQKKYDEAIESLNKYIELNPKDDAGYSELGMVYNYLQRYDEAIEQFKKSIAINPHNIRSFLGMFNIYMVKNDYTTALAYLKEAMTLQPRNIFTCRSLFAFYNKKLRKTGLRGEGLKVFNELARGGFLPEGFSDMVDKMNSKENISEEVKRWIASDTGKIIKICKDGGIRIILLDYPGNDKESSDLMEALAASNSVSFVSNCRIFSKLKHAGEKMDDYFSPDGHCNAKGYEIMAQAIYEQITKDKMFCLN